MKLSETAKQLVQYLQDVAPKLETLDDIDDKLRIARSELAITKEQVARANTELESIKRAAKTQADMEVVAHAETMDYHARELAAMKEKSDKARQMLNGLEGTIMLKRTEHDQILASIESLRKRIG